MDTDAAKTADRGAMDRASTRRVLWASLLGCTIEWYDYLLFGTATSLVFAQQYFPSGDSAVSQLQSYLAFALSFFVRPFGGAAFAHFGDRYGRKKTLIATLVLMGLGTALIGLLPNYQTIGVAAPICLLLLRLVQGLGVGGEWGGAILLTYENAPSGRRSFFGSVPQMGVALGVCLSSLAMMLVSKLPPEDFRSWGWRLPFLFSLVLVAVGLWMRSRIDETPEFQAAVAERRTVRSPLGRTLRAHWREVLMACCAKAVDTGPFYLCTVFVISYTTKVLGLPSSAALNALLICAALAALVMPLGGLLADRYGSRRIFMLGCVATMVAAAPYFRILDTRTTGGVIAATFLMLVCVWPFATSLLGVVTADLFATEVRYTGITLGYQIGAALVGGTAPLFATWLLQVDHSRWRFIALFLAATGAVSALSVAFMPRRPARRSSQTH